MSKHVSKLLEWDQVVPLVCAAYNSLPNEHSKKSSFFCMFGRDPIVPLNSLLKPMVRYLGRDENILSLEALNMYQLVLTDLELARKSMIPRHLHLTWN